MSLIVILWTKRITISFLFFFFWESPFLKERSENAYSLMDGLKFAQVHCLIALVVSLSALSNAYVLIILQE